MDADKLEFLRNDFIFKLKHLAPDATGIWGVMNGQQMVEHFSEVVKNASGKLKLPQINHGEKLEKFRNFLMSDKPFDQNTKNPFLGEATQPAKHSTIQAAIAELQHEISDFIEIFKKNPQLTTQNPFFGQLTFEENVQLLYKHAQHHLKQFGLISSN